MLKKNIPLSTECLSQVQYWSDDRRQIIRHCLMIIFL